MKFYQHMISFLRFSNELDRRPPFQAFGYLESGKGPAEAAFREGPASLTQWCKEAFADQMEFL
jgi:hypothetical protein